jgi:NAD(P)-dependent dehydrogenase (short-subunit alcohol dehydrogenase family)
MKKHLRALVTGGARRIGAGLVRRCAELDLSVTVHVWQSAAEAAELIETLPNKELHSVSCCDLSDQAARRAWLENLEEFDLVINNASCYRLTAPGQEETPENRQRYWQVNYLAPLEIITRQLNYARQRDRSITVINLLDCDVLNADGGIKDAEEPAPGVDSYLYSRIMLAYMTKALAAEAADHLRINAIAPGPVLPPVNCTTAGMTRILDRVPLHRQVGVEEIANAVDFFWESSSLTGVILPVDGGMHLNN